MSILGGIRQGLGNIGTSLMQGARNVGDFAGLDGQFGYQGTWNQPASGWNIPTSTGSGELGQITDNRFIGDNSSLGNIAHSVSNSGLGQWVGNQNSQDWKNYGEFAKNFGGIGLGYLNYKNNKALANRQMQAMDFQQQLNIDAEQRRRKAQGNISSAFQSSGLGTIQG